MRSVRKLVRGGLRRTARIVRPVVHAPRVDESGEVFVPRGLHALGVRVNRRLIEAGRMPPWILTAEEARQYWSSREGGSADNDPGAYARKDPAIVHFLHGFWQPEVSTDDRLLELGCGGGGNLRPLLELGYRRLAGVEINPAAIETLRRVHPELAGVAELIVGSLEDTLPALPDDSCDTVLSMAVVQHVHPASRRVFGEIVRVAAKHICVIESETANTAQLFARNYRRVFERLGCVQVREARLDRSSRPEVPRVYDGYVARLFQVPAR